MHYLIPTARTIHTRVKTSLQITDKTIPLYELTYFTGKGGAYIRLVLQCINIQNCQLIVSLACV